MKATDALPVPYEEVLIWWDSTSGMQRRVARLDASGNSFQLSTFMSSTKGQYLAPIGQVEKWEPIVSGSEHAKLTAENAALRVDLNDARSNWEAAAEELRQADASTAVNAALMMPCHCAGPETGVRCVPGCDAPCTTGCQMNPTGDPQNDCGNCMLDTRRAESADVDLAKDAARYRWMRSKDNLNACDLVTMLWDNKLDAAVDAAMQDGRPAKVIDDDKRDAEPHYGQNCPVGMVQVEFVGADPKARISDYGWRPTKSAFLDIYVDGQRFNITVGNIYGREERGLHIVTSGEIVVDNKCMNALEICYKTQRADAAGVTP